MKKTKLLELFAFGKIGTSILFAPIDDIPQAIEEPPEIPEQIPEDFLDEVPETFIDEPDESFFIDDEPEQYHIDEEIDDDYSDIDASDMLHLEPVQQDIAESIDETDTSNTDEPVDSNDTQAVPIESENIKSTETDTISHEVDDSNSSAESQNDIISKQTNHVKHRTSLPKTISVKSPIRPHTVNKTKPQDDNYDTVAQNWIKEHGLDIDKSKAFII